LKLVNLKLVKHWRLKITKSRAIDRPSCFSSRLLFYLAAKQKYPLRICAETCDFTGRGSLRVHRSLSRETKHGARTWKSAVYRPRFSHEPHSERSVSELLWWLFVARSSPARAMFRRTYVWIITRACDEFVIIADILSPLCGSPSVQQAVSHKGETNLVYGRALWIEKPWIYILLKTPLFILDFYGVISRGTNCCRDLYII